MSNQYDLYSPAALVEHAETLGGALAHWETRNPDKSNAGVRQAANTAVDEIDAMLRKLHHIRGQLIGEIRRYDDECDARVDALLAARRAGVQ